MAGSTAEGVPEVSVIMAVHAGARLDHFLLAIESIRNQTLTGWELLIAADGPLTREQEDFLASLADVRVRIVRSPVRKGPASARNAALALARGRYVAIMDADDLSMPERLAAQAEYLAAHDVDVVGTAYEVIDESGRVTGRKLMPESPATVRRTAAWFCPLNHPTVMGRIEAMRMFGYDESFRFGEDYRLWLRMLLSGRSLGNINRCLVRYREVERHFGKRIGWTPATCDLRNKVLAARLVPLWMKPWVLAGALASFLIRLSPPWVVGALSRIRNRITARVSAQGDDRGTPGAESAPADQAPDRRSG